MDQDMDFIHFILLFFIFLFPMFTDTLYHSLYVTHTASVAARDIGHYQ